MAVQVQEAWQDDNSALRVVPDEQVQGAEGVEVLPVLEEALALLGLTEVDVHAWSEVLVAQAVQDGSAHPSLSASAQALEVIGRMVAMARARSHIEATLVVSVQDLLLRAGEKLLAQRGIDDVSALGRTAHQTWRAHTKAAVAGELQVALGVGVSEARQLVAVASAPARVRVPVLEALRRGEVSWVMVRRFQSRTSRLEPDDAADVARILFGTDPAQAAAERLDPDGELTHRPWHHAEYFAALDREVARARGRDERGERERRRMAMALRDARLDVSDDGTATLSVTGSLATMLALNGRIDAMARRCRKGGDERTLAQLRADLFAALALFGTVDLPGPDADAPDRIVTPDDVEALAAVINASPPGQVELVMPWDALLGQAVCPSCRGAVVPPAGSAGRSQPSTPVPDRSVPPGTDERSSPPGWVGELRGYPSAFVMPDEAREIALRPGSVFYRLLTDPADGRCLERSIARYAPDADMRRQIRAADVYGRGPGCRRPAAACEIDHEHPWGQGGSTSEVNLNAKALLDHFRKTKGLWSSVMDFRRDLTWTTLLGQVARTRGHDYRQYRDAFERLTAAPAEAVTGRVTEQSDLAERRDLANQVLYAALVSRRPGEKTQADDDVDGCEDWLCFSEWGSVSYQDPSGRRRYGTPPDPVTPEQLLALADDRAEAPEPTRRHHEPPPF